MTHSKRQTKVISIAESCVAKFENIAQISGLI